MKDSVQSMATDLTGGNVVSTLLKFAFPLFVSNALQAAYNMVDMIIVGQFIGGAGMSAVSIGGDILHLLTFVAMGFSSAGQVIIARNTGAGRKQDVSGTIGTMFTFLLGISLVISLVCYLLRNSILSLVNTPSLSWDYTMDYTVTCIAGLFFIYGYNIVSAILRGMGDSRRPFVFVAIAAVLNTVLDYLFVVIFGMEVFGAALATVIGQGVSFIISIVYLYKKRESFGFDFKIRSFAVDSKYLLPLVELGIPMAIQSASVSLSKVVLMAWINIEGVVYSALAGIYNKINMMAGIISMSFTTAGSTMVGQNLGAGKYKKIPEILVVIAVCGIVLFTALSAVMYLFPDSVYAMFTSDAPVLACAAILTLPTILNFYGSATRSVAFALINGSGNTKLNLFVALLDGLVARIGVAYIMCFLMNKGAFGCWMGDAVAGFVPIVIGLVFFFFGKWRN